MKNNGLITAKNISCLLSELLNILEIQMNYISFFTFRYFALKHNVQYVFLKNS